MQPREIKSPAPPVRERRRQQKEMLQLPREYRITSSPRHRSKKKKKKINTLEREQKNKPLKRLMNFKSASH